MTVKLSREQAISLWDAAFEQPRSPRSPEYKDGVRWALLRYTPDPEPVPAYVIPGTAVSDAWHAGVIEGHNIAAIKGGE